jgi:hypothetical protein
MADVWILDSNLDAILCANNICFCFAWCLADLVCVQDEGAVPFVPLAQINDKNVQGPSFLTVVFRKIVAKFVL